MAKNMIRKTLAIGSGSALVATLFAVAPAYANDSVVTELAAGSSFNIVVGEENGMTLKTTMSPGLAGNETTLHYRVSNPSGADLQLGVADTNNATYSGARTNVVDSSTNDGEIWEYGESAENTTDSNSTVGDFQTSLTDFVVVPTGTAVGESDNNNWLYIGVVDGDVDVTVTVTAWLDTAAGASNAQDSAEIAGNTVTLNFYDQANVSASTVLTTPVNGAASVSATTTTVPELNGNQLGADFLDVAFTSQGNTNAVLAENTSSDAAETPSMGTTTYSDVTDSWTSTFYLAYSNATDAFNGTDAASNTTDGDLTNGELLAFATGSDTVSVTVLTHGLDTDESYVVTSTTDYNSANISAAASDAARPITFTTGALTTAFSFVTEDTGLGGDSDISTPEAFTAGAFRFFQVGTHSTVQAKGVYSATPYIGTTKLGAIASSAGSAITADDTKAAIAATSTIEGKANAAASSASTLVVKTGTTSVTATATIYYTDSDDLNRVKTVGAGIPVTTLIESATGTFTINGKAAGVTSDTVYTDANGQITTTVATTTASSASNTVTLEIRPQSTAANNAGGAEFVINWDDAAYVLEDENTVGDQPGSNADSFRHINTGGTYTYGFALLDQWGQPAPADKWRLQTVNSGRTVSSDTHSLSNGRVNVAVADGAQGSGSTITTTVNVQKLVSGTWTTQATESWDGTGFGQVVINVADSSTEAIVFDADSGSTYQSTLNSLTADLADGIAAAATEAQNRRTLNVDQPDYTNDVVINGRVTAAATGQAKAGTFVTLSGPSNVLFSYGDVDSFGSIVVPTDASGDFGVKLFSNTAQKNTVITATTANGATKTVKVTFDAAGPRTGTTLTVSATGAQPGQTAIFTGTLTDKWGNPVDTDQTATNAAGATSLDAGDARLTVTYTGPGLLSGTLPVETGADGTFSVRVLLGTNDTGTMTVSATYGAANGTISSADTGDNIDVTGTTTVTIGGEKAATKVNAGSFKGYVAVYARGYEGQRLSAKIGNDWVIVDPIVNNQENGTLHRTVDFTGAGVDIAVRIYIDRVLIDTINLTTK